MRYLNFKLIIVFLYLISSSSTYSIEHPNVKNIVLYKVPKKLEDFEFKNMSDDLYKLSEFNDKLLILNFWATWCAPCREEMPSLDKLMNDKLFNNLIIVPINIGREDLSKSKKFFNEIEIKNLDIYYDHTNEIPKKLSLRGVPTTILINKDGEEFARIIGAINFMDSKFVNWLNKYD